MKPRKHNYVVGYVGENQVAYGKDKEGLATWVELMTFKQAHSRVKKLSSTEVSRAVFKLVSVEVTKSKKNA